MSARKSKIKRSRRGSKKRRPATAPLPEKSVDSLVKRTKGFWILMTAFFFSGLCGLIYEVIWSRHMTLVFGNTTYAISAVLGIFMFGLALGSYLCGKLLPKFKNLLKVYALLEVAVGVYAALFISILSGIQVIHSALFPSIYSNYVLLNLIRILLSFVLLLVPTTLMGATVPLLGQALTRSPRFIGGDIGLLYAFNTFGAAAGCFVSAFLLIPAVGIQVTILLGAALNVAVGLTAWSLSRGVRTTEGEDREEAESSPAVALPGRAAITDRQASCALVIYTLSGFLALVYEVAWSRALILVFGTSVYAFATMLTTFLLGIALGSIFLGRFMDRVKNPLFLFGLIQTAIGVSIFITTPLIGRLPDFFLTYFSTHDTSWKTIAMVEFGVCFLIMIGTTFASGALFPLVSRIFMHRRGFKIGRTVADVYTFNTVGAILGSLTTGFVLIPMIGVEKSLLLGGALSVLIASFWMLVAMEVSKAAKVAWGGGLALVAMAGLILLPSWNPKIMNSGVYLYGNLMGKTAVTPDISSVMSRFKLLFYREGPSATVTVFEGHYRFLRVNGKTDAGDSSDNYTQILLGLLPVMYSKSPVNALVIGLGTGITLGSVLDYPIQEVDCIEISPAVVEASRYFNKANGYALDSPKTKLYVLDGRTWLMAMPKTYDLITSEPSHPWQTGNANLFTVDFFKLAVNRLNKSGVFCQWLPYYRMEEEHFRLLVGSFKQVFPYVNIWMANTDVLLIGSAEPLRLDYTEIQSRMAMPKIKERFAKVGILTPEDFLSFFYLDDAAVAEFVRGVEGVNSDNYPIIEFFAPKYLLARVKPDTFFALLRLSYDSKLPFGNVENMVTIERERLDSRAAYFRQWRIPEVVIRQMLKHAQNPAGPANP